MIRGAGAYGWEPPDVAGLEQFGATILDNAGLSARAIADQLGHAQPSLTQNVYMGRKIASTQAATVLQQLA
jgi:integrase